MKDIRVEPGSELVLGAKGRDRDFLPGQQVESGSFHNNPGLILLKLALMLENEARIIGIDVEHGLTIHNFLRNDCEFRTFLIDNSFIVDVMLGGLLVGLGDVLNSLEGILDGLNVRMKNFIGIFGVPKVKIIRTGDSLGLFIGDVGMEVRRPIFMFLFGYDALMGVVL